MRKDRLYRKILVLAIIGLFVGTSSIVIGEIEIINILYIKQFSVSKLDEVWVNNDYNETNVDDYGIINFSEIQEGIKNVSTNGTVNVFNGNYTENLVISKKIDLVALGEDDIGDDADGAIIDCNKRGNGINIIESQVTVAGFTIQNSGALNYGINIGASDVYIKNCQTTNNFFGIQVLGMDVQNVIIEGCNISYNDYIGVIFIDNTICNKIYDCDFIKNKYGVFLFDSADNTINQCRFSDNYIVGIDIQGPMAASNTISYCRIENSKYGIFLMSNTNGNYITHNDFLNNNNWHVVFRFCFNQNFDRNYWKPIQLPNWRDPSAAPDRVTISYRIVGEIGTPTRSIPWLNVDPNAAHEPNTF